MTADPTQFEEPIQRIRRRIEELSAMESEPARQAEIAELQLKLTKVSSEIYSQLSPWQKTLVARHPQRPYTLDVIAALIDDWLEIHGDRKFGDDPAIVAGFGRFRGHAVCVVGHQKGRNTKENLHRNFGSAHPEGYRKALRLMRCASKFGLPVVSLIDTPGAFPGVGAEERHIAESIALNLREMMVLPTPVVAVVIGEGGSGGALGIGVADSVLVMENAYYSVISPEGCAAILWKHRKHAPEAAEALKLTAQDLKELNVIDEVVPEPLGGAHHDHRAAASALKEAIVKHLQRLAKLPKKDLLDQRYAKFRAMGRFAEEGC